MPCLLEEVELPSVGTKEAAPPSYIVGAPPLYIVPGFYVLKIKIQSNATY
jgi:hypothetical protein